MSSSTFKIDSFRFVSEANQGVSLEQSASFRSEFKRQVHTFSTRMKIESSEVIKSIMLLAYACLAPFSGFYQVCRRSIGVGRYLRDLTGIPKPVISTLFQFAILPIRVVDKVEIAVSTSVGFMVSQGGKWIVSWVKKPSAPSDTPKIRDRHYYSLGAILLATGAAFSTVPLIQIVALTLLFGQINVAVVRRLNRRQCPGYDAFMERYERSSLKGHEIQIEEDPSLSLDRERYETTAITKKAALAFAVLGSLSLSPLVLPVSELAILLATMNTASLIASQVFASWKQKSVQENLDDYAALIGIKWTEEKMKQSWSQLIEIRREAIGKKWEELGAEEWENFEKRLEKLEKAIESQILDPDVPLYALASFRATRTRNWTHYLLTGTGQVAVAISAIYLRIFAL